MRLSFKVLLQCVVMAVLAFAGSLTAFANQSAIVDCKQGGQVVVTSGLSSTTKVLQSFPSCTITVNIHGGGLATIFSDNVGTPLANPFTAQNSPYSGSGFFYAANGRYDVIISGGGLSAPLTFSDILLNDPASLSGCSQLPALTGDITSAGGTCTTVLPNVASAGTGLKTTINAKGQATGVTTAASTDLSDTALIARLNAAANFGVNPISGGPITGTTASFTTVSDNGETVAGEIAPDVTGRQLGDASHRWDAFIRNLDVTGTVSGLIAGTGTTNTISKFASASTIGNSGITDNGTTVSTSEPVLLKSLNSIQFADQFSGATADVKIVACLAAVSSGGTCDARGFGATTQSIAATIVVSADQTLLFAPTTKFQAATPSLNMFTVQPNGMVKGFSFDCGNQPSYTGILFQNDPTKFYTNGQKTEIADISTTNCSAVTGFTGLKLSSTSNTLGVAFIKVHGWRIWGGSDGMFFTTSGTGFVNGNHFENMVFSNQVHGWHITGVSGGAIQGNICAPCSYEKDLVGTNGILIDGTAGSINANQFIGTIWDTTTPISVTNPSATGNLFQGDFNGTITNDGQNTYLDLSQGVFFVNNLTPTFVNINVTAITSILAAIGAPSNPVVIRGGSGSTTDLCVNNVANTKSLICVTDTGSYLIGGSSSGTLTINPPSAASGTLNYPAVGAGTITQTIASGTAAMTTAGITTGACGSTVTVAATGVATTDVISISHNAAVTIGNGGGLTLNAWPTSGNVNFNYCNSSAGTITPTAMTINWNVTR